MKTNLVRAALACAALAFTNAAAMATVTTSQGTPIGLEGDPGSLVATGTTNADGVVTFDHLKKGNYVLTIPPVIVAPAHGKPNHLKPRMTILDAHGAQTASAVSFDVCTCAGGKQGTRLHFTIAKDGDGVQLEISDQGSSSNLPGLTQ